MIDENIQVIWDTAFQKSLNRKIASHSPELEWTSYDTGMIGSKLLVIGSAIFLPQLGEFTSMLSDIGGVVFSFAKSQDTSPRAENYTKTILKNYPQITQNVLQQVEKIYSDFNEFVDKQLEESYQKKLDESVDAIKQAQEISQRSDAERSEAMASLENLKSEIERLSKLF